MKITPISLNYIQQNKSQSAVSSLLHMNNALQADTVSFSGKDEEQKAKMLYDLYPKHKGIIYKKVKDEDGNVTEKIPVEVDIVKQYDSFCFVRDGKILGYVQLTYVPEEDRKDVKHDYLYRNYKKEGIIGDRIIVDYLKNKYEDKYCGMGHLGDLVAVDACNKLGIEPNVVSESVPDAAPLHYMRGKRFVPYKKYLDRYDRKSKDIFGKSPNETVKKIIENTPKGERFDTSEITQMPLMYMPKEMIKELEEELKEHPIF